MIIKSLVMKNFKSHWDTRIEFNTGISIIMGGNGAGKSSILEAVSFALFKQHSGKKIEQLITIGNNGNKKMVVQLEFSSNGRTYRVLRERSKNSSKAKIEILEGEVFQPLSSGDKQVTEEVQGLLEMDGDLFLNAVYVRQGEIANLVDKTPSEKKQVIGKLLGIESLEKAWKNMLPLMNHYEKQKEKLDGKIEALAGLNDEIISKKNDKTLIDQRINEISLKVKKIEEELEVLSKKANSLDEDKSAYEKAVNSIESKKQLLEGLKNEQKHLNTQIVEIENKENEIIIIEPKLSKLEVLKKLKDSLDNLKALKSNKKHINDVLEKIKEYNIVLDENKKFYEDYSKLSDEILDLDAKRTVFEGSRALMKRNMKIKEETLKKMNISHDKLVKVINEYNEALGTGFSLVEELETYLKSVKPDISNKIEILTGNINGLEKELSNLNLQNRELKKPIGDLENVKDKCPVCKSSIDSYKREELIDDYTSQIKLNEKRIIQLKSDLETTRSEKNTLDARLAEIHSVNIELLREQLKNLEDGRKELIAVKSDIKDLENRVSALNQIDERLKEKKELLKTIKPKYEEYLVAEGLLKSLGDPEELAMKRDEYQDDEDVLKEEISSLIEVTEGSVENLDDEIKYLEKLSERYQQLSGAVHQKTNLINRMNEITEGIKELNEQLERFEKDVNEIAYDKKLHIKLQKELEIKNSRIFDLNGKKKEYIGTESGLNIYIRELETKLDSYHKYQKEIKNLKDFLKLLNHIRDIYGKDGVQKDLRNISRPLIEQNTREFFEKFNFEYSDIKLDEDYDVTVYGPAGENNLDMISGGEKIAVALALRLGITQTLSGGNLELIMLDEPTIHLDAYRRQELIELLKRMSIIPQMIIVTHDPDLEEAADHILRVKKEEGKSKISDS